MTKLYDCRIAFAETLVTLADSNPRIVVLTNDATSSSKLGNFANKYPQRFINVGIAEQNLIGMAAGLANGGTLPFVSGAACFLSARALEQIKADLAYSKANVKICGMSSGVAYGPLGPTHHSIEDIAWLRALDGMTILLPADPVETRQAVLQAAELEGPVYIRVSRMGVPALLPEDYQLNVGKAVVMHKGTDITIISNGTLLWKALQAADILAAEGIQARVLNMSTVKPLDDQAIVQAARETGGIVTVEESTIAGGMGSGVAEIVVQTCPVPMRLMGFTSFAPTGPVEFILDYCHLNTSSIVENAKYVLREKKG